MNIIFIIWGGGDFKFLIKGEECYYTYIPANQCHVGESPSMTPLHDHVCRFTIVYGNPIQNNLMLKCMGGICR